MNSNAIPIPTGIPINAVSSLAWWVHSRQWWLRRCSSLTGSSNWKSTRRMRLSTHNRETSWETDSNSTSNSCAWSPWSRDLTHLQNKTSCASADGQPRDALWAELCYGPITIAIRARFEYDSTTIRLRFGYNTLQHATRFFVRSHTRSYTRISGRRVLHVD